MHAAYLSGQLKGSDGLKGYRVIPRPVYETAHQYEVLPTAEDPFPTSVRFMLRQHHDQWTDRQEKHLPAILDMAQRRQDIYRDRSWHRSDLSE